MFRYADGLTVEQCKGLAAQAAFFAPGEAEVHRLVKATKCPTPEKPEKQAIIPGLLGNLSKIDPVELPKTKPETPGAFCVVQFREWSDEYRIRTRIEATNKKPPLPEGHRETFTLSHRAAKKIADSCDYVSRKKGGYKTFLTLTFTPEQREKIEAEETTIQREVSRFCDGLTKMYKRGWQADGKQAEAAHSDDFLYCWVAEVPDNAEGEPNPHVHLLMNWRVKYALFDAWASRIENLWGMGFAHLEKIKDTDAAAAYMMKAAGYLCKAQGKADQGTIRGNRYGINAPARAPDWETISETQLHIMGKLIADVEQHITEKFGHLYDQRRAIKKKMEETAKGSRIRHAAGHALEKVRAEIKKLPIVASKYQIILKGKHAYGQFISWASATTSINNGWLPDKGPGESYKAGGRPDTLWYAAFKAAHYWRRALRRIRHLTDYEWFSLMDSASDYMQYEREPYELN